MTIASNYTQLMESIRLVAQEHGRDPKDVTLIAVSKTVDAAAVQNAIDAGITLFGENRVQEAGKKIPQLSGTFSFHLIGHLQSNKARDAVKLFDLIHSIDKESTAERVQHEAAKLGKIQRILIQVNSSGETTKSGIEPDKAIELARFCHAQENLQLEGLMTIGPFVDDQEQVRNCFSNTRKLLDVINRELGAAMQELSMGMSGDYKTAIQEGATMIRVGTALFGARIQ